MHKGWQLLLVVVCGAGAFYAAADWSQQRNSPAGAGSSAIVAAVTSGAAPRPPSGADAVAAQARSAFPMDRSRAIPSSTGDAFTSLSWLRAPPPAPPAPPPPPPAPPPPPPAPTAPALPFTFIGMVERGTDRPQAYLTKGEALLIVAAGDVIDGKTYRVESLSSSGVVLTYLPLGTRQTINVPGGPQ